MPTCLNPFGPKPCNMHVMSSIFSHQMPSVAKFHGKDGPERNSQSTCSKRYIHSEPWFMPTFPDNDAGPKEILPPNHLLDASNGPPLTKHPQTPPTNTGTSSIKHFISPIISSSLQDFPKIASLVYLLLRLQFLEQVTIPQRLKLCLHLNFSLPPSSSLQWDHSNHSLFTT